MNNQRRFIFGKFPFDSGEIQQIEIRPGQRARDEEGILRGVLKQLGWGLPDFK